MGKNLYILAATLFVVSLICFGVAHTPVASNTGDQKLWHMMGLVLLLGALVVTMGGMLTSLFEQAERRAEEKARVERESRRAGH